MLTRLTAIVLALALRHGHADADRLRAVAADIWRAAETSPVFCGFANHEATALALVAIAEHESGFSPAVQRCTHDPRSTQYGLFQLQGHVAMGGHTKTQVCSDNALAANLAASVLARFRRVGSLLTMAQGYASGDTRVRSKAAQEIAALIATLLWRERIFVSYRNQCLEASYLP
jgi:hypothetical protein